MPNKREGGGGRKVFENLVSGRVLINGGRGSGKSKKKLFTLDCTIMSMITMQLFQVLETRISQLLHKKVKQLKENSRHQKK